MYIYLSLLQTFLKAPNFLNISFEITLLLEIGFFVVLKFTNQTLQNVTFVTSLNCWKEIQKMKNGEYFVIAVKF